MAELRATAAAAATSPSDSLVEIDHVVFGYDASRTILNDVSHDFMALHYYVTPERQREQFAAVGLELVELRAADGRIPAAGDDAADSPDLHYVARRGAGGGFYSARDGG
jgi:hypothetical protein